MWRCVKCLALDLHARASPVALHDNVVDDDDNYPQKDTNVVCIWSSTFLVHFPHMEPAVRGHVLSAEILFILIFYSVLLLLPAFIFSRLVCLFLVLFVFFFFFRCSDVCLSLRYSENVCQSFLKPN